MRVRQLSVKSVLCSWTCFLIAQWHSRSLGAQSLAGAFCVGNADSQSHYSVQPNIQGSLNPIPLNPHKNWGGILVHDENNTVTGTVPQKGCLCPKTWPELTSSPHQQAPVAVCVWHPLFPGGTKHCRGRHTKEGSARRKDDAMHLVRNYHHVPYWEKPHRITRPSTET